MAIEMRVAFLTNMIPPYQKPLYLLLSQQYSKFRLFVSTAMEPNRPWLPEWSGLDVVRQKGITIPRTWRHPSGFAEPISMHFPTDTFGQMRRFQPDVIVSVEMGFRTLMAFLYVKLHRQSRLLIWSEVTGRTESGRGAVRLWVRRILARGADGFFALGHDGVAYVRSLGVNESRIFRIAYSTDQTPFESIPLERSGAAAKRLVFSGQLVARKGLGPFLEALGRWAAMHPERAIEFRIVGDGPEREALGKMVLPDNVKLDFSGPVQYEALPEIYAECGILVLPTLADTWAVVVNEALASGLPVMGSIYSQAVEEMVEDGRSGWKFRPDDAEGMFKAIDCALSSGEAELNTMRSFARMKAHQVTPELTAAVFQEALGQS